MDQWEKLSFSFPAEKNRFLGILSGGMMPGQMMSMGGDPAVTSVFALCGASLCFVAEVTAFFLQDAQDVV